MTDQTRLIMAVNLLGNPNDFDRIGAVIGDRRIRLIEDNCESMGAELGGHKTGTFGVMGSFSSYFSHHISTMEGGLTVTDDEELYHVMLSLRSHGWTRNLPAENRVAPKGDDPFPSSRSGSCCPDTICARSSCQARSGSSSCKSYRP